MPITITPAPAGDSGGIGVDGWVSDSNTWTYSSEDAPTFVASVNADMTGVLSAGMRIKLTQTTPKYFIVTAVGSFGGGVTSVALYGGTDYSLANAAISSPAYSPVKAPLGFPLNPAKWTVRVAWGDGFTQNTPVAGTWYNATSFDVPIGAWLLGYRADVQIQVDAAVENYATSAATLSTTNDGASDYELEDVSYFEAGAVAAGSINYDKMFSAYKHVVLATKTIYYLNVKTTNLGATTIYVVAQHEEAAYFTAVCAYV